MTHIAIDIDFLLALHILKRDSPHISVSVVWWVKIRTTELAVSAVKGKTKEG